MNRLVGSVVLAVVLMGVGQGSHASPIVYIAHMSGPAESPPVASPGFGLGVVEFDLAAHSMRVAFTFHDLVGTTTASHIHGPTAVAGAGNASVITQVPRFVGFPVGVTDGVYDMTFDTSLASTYNPAFVTANGNSVANAEAALAAALAAGKAYLNVHTTFAPTGEIRGFLQAVPEPASLVSGGLGLLAGLGLAWRRRRAFA